MNATTANQSTHCILVAGLQPNLRVDEHNKALIEAYAEGVCMKGRDGLTNASGSFDMLAPLMRAVP